MKEWFADFIEDNPEINMEKFNQWIESIDADKYLADSGYVKRKSAFGEVWIKKHKLGDK